ncbi:MAG: DEAD/DEAH box helicase [Chloroflexi bacterium]|nr:DEAD/DEAH box helicase [Chloroflexota bacterium]
MAASKKNLLSAFHPAIQRWFRSKFEGPTLPQQRGWPAIHSGQDTLISAPTGSGKTLAAFLAAIDSLFRQGLEDDLPNQCQVVYVSPLKALSNDVQKNLAQPLEEIRQVAAGMGLEVPEIRVLVRTGDTPASQRQAMTRKPPHILVTTPESLYILLTSVKGSDMLRNVRTVIVDEIHAVARDKRGSHLALSLERLEALANGRPVRIGLSATQRPIEEVARFLVGTKRLDASGKPQCAIIDEGQVHLPAVALELPGSPLEAVCSNETWDEIYDRLAELIRQRRTTLVFVNTRRLAERVTFQLSKRLGEENITSHHGSLSREQRLQAEERLKAGQLKALVATASLELGIDIGEVDLVCQLASTRSIATLLQRVGRSGHALGRTPRGRLFPLTRDDLVECVALLASVRSGNLDRLSIPEKPLDILAQQMVASVAMNDWDEDELFNLCLGAYPYRNLTREEYEQVGQMLSQGFSTRRGRRSVYLHYDGVGRRFRARRGARLAAVTSGGAIPETADYQVILEPQNMPVGTVNEDFAIESMPGDIFQLGISSWRILRVEPGKVRVEDARGLPPTIPFWLGEAPARTDELSTAVSNLRREIEARLPNIEEAKGWVIDQTGIDIAAADQLVEYLWATKRALGVVPSQQNIVFERFFDESGGMQLVVHTPFGARINRAWGLALRKRFCRTFNFELQAAANDDAMVFSLGPQHSFPLEDVFSYLKPETAKEILVQALLAAPMFQTRWRWNATRALAILRHEGGKKVPMPIQRMRADDLLTAVFPDQMACQENLVGDVEVPDHPLVKEVVRDCLTEAMDVDGFMELLKATLDKRVNLVAVDSVEPSPMSHEILTVKPYAFLDDAPLEERRTQAVFMRRTLDIQSSDDVGKLDPEAIQRVREQAWPEVESVEELHDALLLLGYLTQEEMKPFEEFLDTLLTEKRATKLWVSAGRYVFVACERLPQFEAVLPEARYEPRVQAPPRERAVTWSSEEALRELVRGRMEGLGPVTCGQLAWSLGLEERAVDLALIALEGEGFALRGRFESQDGPIEWCDRRLLARIHRYTLDRLRKEIEPVSAADMMRSLFVWHHLDPEHRLDGAMGLAALLEVLEGYEAPASAWENHILPPRLHHYNISWLDQLCLSGELAWARLHPSTGSDGRRAGATRSLPVALLFRDNLPLHLATVSQTPVEEIRLSGLARHIVEVLQDRGACFFQELVQRTRQMPSDVQNGLGELVSWGLVTCDGFAGLRALVSPLRNRSNHRLRSPRARKLNLRPSDRMAAGRWSQLDRSLDDSISEAERIEFAARRLLKRYGVVFHRLLLRENSAPRWRELVRVYRMLEARGEIRGGRFVAGFSGEQYALPEAVQQLRAIRRTKPQGTLITVNGADPLNLVGIVTPGQRVPALSSNRVLFRDGIPVAVKVGGKVTYLDRLEQEIAPAVEAALRR